MTIDERLEALAARHEALTQTVELLTHDIAELRDLARQDGENIRALAEIHHQRLERLEGGGRGQHLAIGDAMSR